MVVHNASANSGAPPFPTWKSGQGKEIGGKIFSHGGALHGLLIIVHLST